MVNWMQNRWFRRSRGWLLLLLGLGLAMSLGWLRQPSQVGAEPPKQVELTLAAFPVTRAAYREVLPKFAEYWKQQHNQEVMYYESYAPSGAQTRAVLDGLEADVVALSLALDVKRLESRGLVAPGWESKASQGSIPYSSVVALVTREDNPWNIRSWEDLKQKGLQIVTANPRTSGGARWNVMALWGAAIQNQNEAEAIATLTDVFRQVPALSRDAREATDAFVKQGQGDVLINYENEIVLANQRGENLSYVVPPVTLAVENPVAVVDKNVDKHGNRAVAEAFVQFLYTPEAQEEFAKVGFRVMDPAIANRYSHVTKPVSQVLTVEKDLGGWDAMQTKLFDEGAIFDQIQATLQAEAQSSQP